MLSFKHIDTEDIEHFLGVLNDNYSEWTLIIEQINTLKSIVNNNLL